MEQKKSTKIIINKPNEEKAKKAAEGGGGGANATQVTGAPGSSSAPWYQSKGRERRWHPITFF
jgi:hypothetical protein